MNLFNLCIIDLEKSIEKLKKFQKKFTSAFSTKTRSIEQQSIQYLQGIFLEKGRGNMTNRMPSFIELVPLMNRLENRLPEGDFLKIVSDEDDAIIGSVERIFPNVAHSLAASLFSSKSSASLFLAIFVVEASSSMLNINSRSFIWSLIFCCLSPLNFLYSPGVKPNVALEISAVKMEYSLFF